MRIATIDEFERVVSTQRSAPVPWTPVTDYSFEARRAIEGQHPALIMKVFRPTSVLDVGCGPDAHLVRLLREIKGGGVQGFDIQPPPKQYGWRYSILDERCFPDIRWDLVICREVLEHLTIREVALAVRHLCGYAQHYVYVTTRFCQHPQGLLDVDLADELDPSHITMLNQEFLRLLFVLEGFRRRADLEARMDWQQKERVLVYERAIIIRHQIARGLLEQAAETEGEIE